MLNQLIEAFKQGLEEANKETVSQETYKSQELEKIWNQAQLKKDLKKKRGARLQRLNKQNKKKKDIQEKKTKKTFEDKLVKDGLTLAKDKPPKTTPLDDLDLSPWAKALVYQEVFSPSRRSLRRRPRAQKGGKFIAK